MQVDAFGKKIRDETRPDLGQLASQIERKVELLQGMYKRERVRVSCLCSAGRHACCLMALPPEA